MEETSKTQNTGHRQTEQTNKNSSSYRNSTDEHSPIITLTNNNTMLDPDIRTGHNDNVEKNIDSHRISPPNNIAVKNSQMDKPVTHTAPVIFPKINSIKNLTLKRKPK